ncbi:MAG: hypothetical protein A2190_11845 [Lysobacterales bacterium RIFOXYA1_FULL_69_10]|nr:MAG: hypothetical protein A2190_11845 [Xanthomonadales bacterium RIFOXYA1_FULL_69_10]
MNRPVRTALAAALALAAAPAFAQTYSQTVFFGDSLTDSGHFRPVLVQMGGPQAAILGRFTTNPGLVWSEQLADFYAAAAVSANQGGSNYAVGGARTGTDTASQLGPVPSVQTQVASYLAATGGQADADALYAVWGGANDVFAAIGTAGAGGDPAPVIGQAVAAQVGAIGTLQAAGARYVLVPTVPDIGLTPGFRAQGPAAQAGGTQLSMAYNDALFGGLAQAGLRVIPLDTFSLFQEVVANPGEFGFSNITGTACQPQITAQSVTCNPGTYVTPTAADDYAFADAVHPTANAHTIIADYAASVLEGPRQVAMLPHAQQLAGRTRSDRVAAQWRGGPVGEPGLRAWADLRGDYQKFDEGTGAMVDGEGGGAGLLAGLGWSSGNVHVGGFLGAGSQTLKWGQRSGEFSFDDTTLGAYAGWRGGNGWVGVQASTSQGDYDTERRVDLGPATRVHRASADGDNLTVALDAGWRFDHSALSHGPVVSVVSQRIDIDAMSEDQADLSTSLAYPRREIDSLVGSVGWQFALQMGEHFSPYARLTWDREFEDHDEEAFAQLQSMPGTAPYAVPGLELDEDYGTVMLGARTTLFGLDADAGLAGSVARNGTDSVGVFLNVGRGF